jgi:TPR repeat protein
MKKLFILIVLCSSLFANYFNDAIKLYNDKNFAKAAVDFTKAATNGNIEAAYILGYLYSGGQGVVQDFDISYNWYLKAANAGHTKSQVNLGYMLICGLGTKKDLPKAAKWIKEAKNHGSSQAVLLWKEFNLDKFDNKK